MRTMWMVFALICLAPSAALAEGPSGVRIFAGAGPAALRESFSSSRPGAAFFAGAESSITPWCALGGETSAMSFGSPDEVAGIPEDIVTVDRTNLIALMGLVRIETPVQSGPSLFLVSQAGAAYIHWGDVHVYSTFSPTPGPIDFAGQKQLVWCSAIGAGVRLHFHHPAPSIEGSVQFMALMGRQASTVATPRLSLIY